VVILGIETSCDETAVAVLNGQNVIHLLSSQIDLHKQYGGIVPELACRRHIEAIHPLVKEVLHRAQCPLNKIDAIAVTVGPGLIGALLVGVSFAKALAYGLRIPLLAVHHLEGHIAAVFLEHPKILFPAIALVVSGGHTNLYKIQNKGEYQLLGKTRDDAAGEVLDKGARMMGFDYPGGPIIDRLAKEGDAERFPFPIPHRTGLDFSFSGLKTALMRRLSQHEDQKGTPSFISDMAASYQKAIVASLVEKSLAALKQEKARSMLVVGGVAANSLLRRRMKEEVERMGMALYLPSSGFCTDNAAMIAMAGLSHFERKDFAPLDISPHPNFELGSCSPTA
jgi:N6-L-threonylcarbamoyladenine synthase